LGKGDGDVIEDALRRDLGLDLLDRLWARAGEFSATLYGIEALEIMRTEKVFIHIGTDTDGTTLPQDIGFARDTLAVGLRERAMVANGVLDTELARNGEYPVLDAAE